MSELQRERRQKGEDFQKEIRDSWSYVPSSWRLRISESAGSRPGDELVILPNANLLIEMKRTNGDRFELNMLRPNQLKGLVHFAQANRYNYGMVFISFLNSQIDETYAIPIDDILNALWLKKRNYLTLPDIKGISATLLPLRDKSPRNYDLLPLLQLGRR